MSKYFVLDRSKTYRGFTLEFPGDRYKFWLCVNGKYSAYTSQEALEKAKDNLGATPVDMGHLTKVNY